MLLKISLLAKIPKEDRITYYLIYKPMYENNKAVLPIEIKSIGKTNLEDTYIRTLRALNAEIQSINIYLYLEDLYYVYLKILYNGNQFDINTTIDNALNILEYCKDIDIYIEQDILEQEGIKITKDMLDIYNDLVI